MGTATPQQLNPLIGETSKDTLHNLSVCLDQLGSTLANSHNDPSIFFFCRSVAAALKFESSRLGK